MLRLRRLFILAHRYIGLTVGLLIVVLGVSGSVAVFWREGTELISPAFRIEAPGTQWVSFDRIMQSLHEAHPQRPQPWELNLPWGGPASPIYAVYASPEEKAGVYESPLYVAVNQYTGEIMAQFYWGETPFSWMYNLHSILQAGMTGEEVVGVLGIVFLFIVLSGLYLWWPIGRFSRRQFAARPSDAGPRFEFELHKLAGFYSFLVLAVLAVTGIMIVYTDETVRVLDSVQPLSEPLLDYGNLPVATPIAGRKPLPVDALVGKAREIFPGSEVRTVWMPGVGGKEAYGVSLRQPHDTFDRFYPDTMVWMDPYSGEILRTIDSATFNATRALLPKRYSFHGGEALGLIGRWLVFVAGFVPLFLYVTGIRQWLRMRRRVAVREGVPT
jgi:uncharacterized iron-regulated membrane protein